MGSELLDPDFLRRLDRLRVYAQRHFAGASSGSRRSLRKGSSVEFKDHRPYSHGDDVRRIDWNAYARLEELVLRLYVAEEDLSLYLLLDTSLSLAYGDPPKIDEAKRAAAALGYVGLCGSERVAVVPFSEGIGPSLQPGRGKKYVGSLFKYLQTVETSGQTNLEKAVQEFLARRMRPGLVAIFSDLLDPNGFRRPIDQLLSERFEPVIFHVLDEQEPPTEIGADLVLVDSERGNKVEVTMDIHTRKAFRQRLELFIEEVLAYVKKRGIAYVRIGRDFPFEDALLSYLSRR